jgi:hypothetical protein
MSKYQEIAIAKDVFFGTAGIFYAAEHESMYRKDVLRGNLSDNEKHVILDSVWLSEPVDYGNAWKIAQIMLNEIPVEMESGILGTDGAVLN